VRALPEEFDAGALPGLLAEGWGLEAASVDYAAVGGGSYHWEVVDGVGTRYFATLDDLDKRWLGDTPGDRVRRASSCVRHGGGPP